MWAYIFWVSAIVVLLTFIFTQIKRSAWRRKSWKDVAVEDYRQTLRLDKFARLGAIGVTSAWAVVLAVKPIITREVTVLWVLYLAAWLIIRHHKKFVDHYITHDIFKIA